MNVRPMRQSQELPRLHAALPELSLVRGSTHQALGVYAYPGVGLRAAQAGNAGRVDGVGSLGNRFAQDGKRIHVATCADWPGREYGIRAPHPEETALSWAEVHSFLRIGAMAMADDADNAAEREEIGLADAIRHARAGGPVAVATGRCLHCDDITGDEQRWCGPECRDAWCKERGIK